MKILLLSAYDANSHRYWWQQLKHHFDEHQWTVLTLPARYFSWRIRGNSLTWAMGEQAKKLQADYQLLIATSMVDLSALRGMCPALARIPTLLYFHENQFAYPVSAKLKKSQFSVEPMMVQLYAAISADRLGFNSEFNRQSFIAGVKALLKKLPDHVPTDIVQKLLEKSQILPVPIASVTPPSVVPGELPITDRGLQTPFKLPINEHCHILWNHRWEYDKGPERLLAFVEALAPSLSLSFHVVGQSFRTQPQAFQQIRLILEARGWLGRWSYIESRESYQQLLAQCHIVLSTALHDFQGLSILEGVFAGCLPLVPDRLAYREIFPDNFRYDGAEDVQAEAQRAACHLHAFIANDCDCTGLDKVISAFDWQALDAVYRNSFLTTQQAHKSPKINR